MKKILSFGLAVVMCAGAATALAADFRAGDQASVAVTEVVQNDVYMAGGTVTQAGTVKGDLYAGGGTILVSGPIEGDLVAVGGTISVLGSVGDDIRVGGGTVVIQGTVGSDLLVGGGSVQVLGSGIKGDAVIGGGTVRLDAPVGGDLRIGGGDVYINSVINGSVRGEAKSLTFGKNAVVTGNLEYKSPKEATFETGAIVKGTTTYTAQKEKTNNPAPAAVFAIGAFIPLLMMLVGSLFFGLVFKKYMTAIIGRVHESPLREFGRGIVFLIAAPIISVILLITVVGLPLGILGLIGFVALMIFASFTAPIILGSLLFSWMTKRSRTHVDWASVVLGVVVFYLLGWIPILGWLAQCILILLALGTSVYMKLAFAKEWR